MIMESVFNQVLDRFTGMEPVRCRSAKALTDGRKIYKNGLADNVLPNWSFQEE